MDVAKVEINSAKMFWISGVQFAQPRNSHSAQSLVRFLRDNHIDTIVNLSDFPYTEEYETLYKQAGIQTITGFPLDDRAFTERDYPQLKTVMEGLYQKLGHRVLVHCTAGINRSATLIVYAITHDGYLSAEDVIDKLRQSNMKWRSSPTLTNTTFEQFLKIEKNIQI